MKKNIRNILVTTFLLIGLSSVKSFAAGGNEVRLDKEGAVTIISPSAAEEGISSLQFSVTVDAGNAETVEFAFDKINAQITEYRYNEEEKKLNIYVAGTKALFENGTDTLQMGKILVLDGNGKDVTATVGVIADSVQYVNGTELKVMENVTVPDPVKIHENSGSTGGDNQGGSTGGDNNQGGSTGGDNQGGSTGGDNNQGGSTGGDNQGGSTGGDNNQGGSTGGDNQGGSTGGDNNQDDDDEDEDDTPNQPSQGGTNQSQRPNGNGQGTNQGTQIAGNNRPQGGNQTAQGNGNTQGGNNNSQNTGNTTVNTPVPETTPLPSSAPAVTAAPTTEPTPSTDGSSSSETSQPTSTPEMLPTGSDNQDKTESSSSTNWIFVVVIIVAVLLVGVGVMAVVMLKGKSTANPKSKQDDFYDE